MPSSFISCSFCSLRSVSAGEFYILFLLFNISHCVATVTCSFQVRVFHDWIWKSETNTATKRHEACDFACAKQNCVKTIREGRKIKSFPGWDEVFKHSIFRVVTKIHGDREIVAAFDNFRLVPLTVTKFQNHYVYKPTRCTKFLWLDFIFH